MKRAAGFTLLELMIAVVILAFISIFTARMIQQGTKAKGKIQAEIDRSSAVRGALELMSRDVAQAFHYRDINVELYNAAQKERKKKAQGEKKQVNKSDGTPPPPPPPPDPNAKDPYQLKEEKVITQFLGEKDKLNFTTLNNFRSTKDSAESDQAEVGYYLETCASPTAKQTSSECLWRRTSPYIDEDVTDGGTRTVLLQNVKSLTFRYLGPDHEEEWLETWKTKDGEEVMKDKFPYAVEISLVTLDKKSTPAKEVAMTVVAPLLFPNNKSGSAKDSGEAENVPQGGGR